MNFLIEMSLKQIRWNFATFTAPPVVKWRAQRTIPQLTFTQANRLITIIGPGHCQLKPGIAIHQTIVEFAKKKRL